MRNLSELSNDEIFDLMIEVAEPYTTITNDKEVKAAMAKGIKAGLQAIREKYMPEAVQICAIFDGKPVDGYKLGIFTFMKRFTELMTSDMGLDEVFTSDSRTDGGSSGNATETTEANET